MYEEDGRNSARGGARCRWCGKSDDENVWTEVKRCGRCAHERQPRPPQRKPPRDLGSAPTDLPFSTPRWKQ
jgi:hypothetical protein